MHKILCRPQGGESKCCGGSAFPLEIFMSDSTEKRMKLDFERLSAQIDNSVALYCICAVYDIQFDPNCEADSIGDYLALHDTGSFCDGKTDVHDAILAGMETGERWETLWGEGYSEADYRQLDDLYSTMTAQLDQTGGIDKQQDDTARTCALMALQRNKLIRKSDKDSIAMAKQLDVMIRDNLKDSNMRKADILPQQQQRPDGFVDALKKKYGLTMEMTKDDVMQAFYVWCRSKKYPETVDAEEHALMAILRTMQKNDDLPESTDLPSDFDLSPFSSQFADEPNEFENETYQYLGLLRGEFKAGDD